jgi:hypothetical protein
MEIRYRDAPRPAVRAHRIDLGIKHAHGHRHVARMRRDASLGSIILQNFSSFDDFTA